MNSNRLKNIPVVIYTAALSAVWIFSWMANIVSLLYGKEDIRTLVSAEGIRWFVRSFSETIASLPSEKIILLLIVSGVIYKSGIFTAVKQIFNGELSVKSRYAFSISSITFLCCIIVIFLCAINTWNLLGSVTGAFSSSLLVRGIIPIAFILTISVSVIFGIIYGTFRNVNDIIEAMCYVLRLAAPALISLFPAALLIASLNYLDIQIMSWCSIDTFSYLLYILPFFFSFAEVKGKK